MRESEFRIGIDLGGTKIEGAVLDRSGEVVTRERRPSPHGRYTDTIAAIAGIVETLERRAGVRCTVGVGMPGSISPVTGLVQNANSTWLNGTRFDRDLSLRLGREVRFANDANCFALSEATDGAAAGARTVFGVIMGTGCGGGIVIDGRIVDGPRGIGGEWGHNPLPWPMAAELQIDPCWCGRRGCLETWLSGPALAADHAREVRAVSPAFRLDRSEMERAPPSRVDPEHVVMAAAEGDAAAVATLDRHAERLARALASVVNLIDPDVVVLGGGLSKLDHLYRDVPGLAAPYIFADRPSLTIRPPRWGDSSGVRGAAWLWP